MRVQERRNRSIILTKSQKAWQRVKFKMIDTDNQNNDFHRTCFCVFAHNPFRRGSEGSEDGSKILDHLLYCYPSNIPDRQMEHLLGVLISLYTFTSLSLEGKSLDFISWSNSKLAIKTHNVDENSMLFFVLRAPSVYSDTSISSALEHIRLGLNFVLGPSGLSNINQLKEYLHTNGSRVFQQILPPETPNPLPFSFTNLPNAEWNRASVASTLTELIVMKMDPRLWGSVFFIDNLLLISHSPLDIIRLFAFSSDSENKVPVFLTQSDRKGLTDYRGCIAQIPDEESIEAVLLRFKFEKVLFCVLASPLIDQDLISKIESTVKSALPQITASPIENSKQVCPQNSLVYDSELNMLRAGPSTPEFQNNAILAHDLFVRNPKLKDVIMGNIKEFSVCMNVLSVEHHSSVPGNSKTTLEELYEDALKLNPDLLRFLQSLRVPQ